MKFVLTYTFRSGGSASDRRAAAREAQKLLETWEPSKAVDIKEWVTRADGNGGFSVLEADDPAEMLKDAAVWSSFLEFHFYPVVDIGDAIPKQQAAIEILEGLD